MNPTSRSAPSALIAEDEPLLATALQAELVAFEAHAVDYLLKPVQPAMRT